MEKLTFKQYLESKEQLLKAIENTPISLVEYEVKKYCNLSIGETEDDKELIGLMIGTILGTIIMWIHLFYIIHKISQKA